MKIFTLLKIIADIAKGNEYARFILAEKISNLIYPQYKFSEYGRSFLEDKEFIADYEKFRESNALPVNYHSLDRKYNLFQLLKLTVNLDGDTAECGAYNGASSFFICKQMNNSGKKHHVFDSFEGLSTPQDIDGNYWKKGDLSVSEETIRKNLSDFDFVFYYKGWIPDRFHDVRLNNFSFVHIDVDLYQPTYDSISFFYERTIKGGIIVCDDYGFNSCIGARKAMDDFFTDKPESIITLSSGQGFVIKQ